MASDLKPDDELCLRIGRVARAHVELDLTLRDVHRALVWPSPAMYLASKVTSTHVLMEQCSLMLARADIEESFRVAGLGALDAAAAANKRRNEVVHDMWLDDPDKDDEGPSRWRVYRRVGGQLVAEPREAPRDLTFLERALIDVQRANIRLVGLQMGLHDVLPTLKGTYGGRSGVFTLSSYMAMLEDRFDLHELGNFSLHTEAGR